MAGDSFTTKNGTRGAKPPSGRIAVFFNGLVAKRIRRKGGPFMGMNTLVLVTIGKRTGQERYTPVAWFADGEDRWLVVASAAGSARNPSWYYNLAAAPDRVRVHVDGREVPVVAEQLHGDEREQAWSRIVDESGRFSSYADKTDRELPVIRLSRAG